MVGLLLALYTHQARAQYFEPVSSKTQGTIPFKLVRGLVVIQLKIDGKGPFNFVLDTGVGLMVITDPAMADSVQVPSSRKVKLTGLDEKDEFDAILTPPLKIEIPGFNAYGVGAAIFTQDHFGLSNYAGIPIHGLLGYEFFNRMAVKINFSDSTITACNPESLRHLKKYITLPLTIEHNKPYLITRLHFCDSTTRNCKLLADLGSGHALILNHSDSRAWPLTQTIPANLGVGLTGEIDGKIGRIQAIELGKYNLSSVLSSFPDAGALPDEAPEYDGNLGMYILKKFTVIFDYVNQKLYLKPRYCFKEPFEHDMTGMEYYAAGNDFKHIIISRIEPGSPAEEAHLRTGDELSAINFKKVADMSLEEIDEIFRSKSGRNLLLEVVNHQKRENVIITLRRRI